MVISTDKTVYVMASSDLSFCNCNNKEQDAEIRIEK